MHPTHRISFLLNMARALPATTDVLYFISIGYEFKTITMLGVIYTIAAIVFEIPTGLLADVYGRKKIVALSAVSRAMAFGLIFVSEDIIVICLSHVLLGLSSAAESGALNAWAVDSNKDHKNTLTPLTLLNRWSLAGTASGAIAGSSIVTLMDRDKYVWFFGLLISVLASIAAWNSIELQSKVVTLMARKQKTKFFVSLKKITHQKELRALLVYASLSQFALAGIIKLWQPTFSSLAGNKIIPLFGAIYLLFMVVTMLANELVSRRRLFPNPRMALIIGALLSGAPIYIVAITNSAIFGVSAYVLHVFGYAIAVPVVSSLLHDAIDSSERASMESWFMTIVSSAELAGLAVCGIIVDSFSTQTMLFISASITCIAAIFILFVSNGRRET